MVLGWGGGGGRVTQIMWVPSVHQKGEKNKPAFSCQNIFCSSLLLCCLLVLLTTRSIV